jgi:TolB protein
MPMAADKQDGLRRDGLIVLAMRDGENMHLFAYHPLYLSLTRLTNNSWDDESPALNPDGSQIAFSSRRNGYWNLYILDLASVKVTQITDTPEYDGAPSWSPDKQWIAYESYLNDNLEIVVKSLTDLSSAPIQLTNDPGMDSSPAWSPGGREIAFVSERSGSADIWLAHLDKVDDRFENISKNSDTVESNPVWSPDGRYLAWDAEYNGVSSVYVWDSQNPSQPPVRFQTGSHPVWSPDGTVMLVEVRTPNRTALAGYSFADRSMIYPVTNLPGELVGLDWKGGRLPDLFAAYPISDDARKSASALWNVSLSTNPMPPNGRLGISALDNVSAPYPYLNDAVDESFRELRHQVGIETGWDFLASLENAYFPLTEPPNPGMEANWLYTGRAIAVNTVPAQAGWLVIAKEDYAGQIYWRIFLRARYQDGSMGKPITEIPWDINARYQGDPIAFEAGGEYSFVPTGYWIDFTEIAGRYGWDRLPSLPDWRSYYSAIRYNQYVLTDGLDWKQAMAEVYPPEALVTSTFVPTRTPTASPTVTPGGPVVTATSTPTITLTPTLNPTLTPIP